MNSNSNQTRLAQSASALGAAILGFGIGAKWGSLISGYALLMIITGALIHVAGMYEVQMKNNSERVGTIAKILWLSAWICLRLVIVLIIYFSL